MYNIMYQKATRLTNLALTKAVFQLLCLEKHTPNMQPKSDIFCQIIFSILNCSLPYSETVKRHVISSSVSHLCKPANSVIHLNTLQNIHTF